MDSSEAETAFLGEGATAVTVDMGANCLSWMGGGERRKEWVFGRGWLTGLLTHVAGRWRVWTVNISLGWIFPLTYLRPWYKG